MVRDTLADYIQLWGGILFLVMSPILWLVVAYFGVVQGRYDHVAVQVVAVAYFAVFPAATLLATLVRIVAAALEPKGGSRPVMPSRYASGFHAN